MRRARRAPLEVFIETLGAADLKALADVRLIPGSRRHPQFGAKSLAAALGEIGIAYVHLPELGVAASRARIRRTARYGWPRSEGTQTT